MKKRKDLLSGRRYLLDLSAVPALPDLRHDLPKGFLVVSRTLDGVLSGTPTPEIARLLRTAIDFADEDADRVAPAEITTDDLGAIMSAYQRLRDAGVITVIVDEMPNEPALSSALKQVVAEDGPWVTALLHDGTKLTSGGLIERHLTTILAYSKRTGTAIIARGRSLISRITRSIAALELPHRADRMVERKQEFTAKLFAKPGRRAGKFVVGALITAGGLVNPAIGIAGAVLYFVDP